MECKLAFFIYRIYPELSLLFFLNTKVIPENTFSLIYPMHCR